MSLRDVLNNQSAPVEEEEETSRWEDTKRFAKWAVLGGPAAALAAVPTQKTGNEAADKVQRVIKALGVGTYEAMPQSLITDYITDDKPAGDFEAEGIPENVAQVIGALGGSIPTFGIAGAAVTKAAKAAKVGSALTKGIKVGSKVISPAIVKPAAVLGLLEAVKKTDEDESRIGNIATGIGTGAAFGAIGSKVAPKLSALFKKKLGIDLTDKQIDVFNKRVGNPATRAKEAAVIAKALNKPNLAQYIEQSPYLRERLAQFTSKVGGKAPIISRGKKGVQIFGGEGKDVVKEGVKTSVAGYRNKLTSSQMKRLQREIVTQERERILGKEKPARAVFTKLEKWMNPDDRQALEVSRGNQPAESTSIIKNTYALSNKVHDQTQKLAIVRSDLHRFLKKKGISEDTFNELAEAVHSGTKVSLTPDQGKALRMYRMTMDTMRNWEREAGLNVAKQKFYVYGKRADAGVPIKTSYKPSIKEKKAAFEFASKDVKEGRMAPLQGLEARIKAHHARMMQTSFKDWNRSISFYEAQGAKGKAESMAGLYADITGVPKESAINAFKQDFVRNGVYEAEKALEAIGIQRQSLSDEVYKHLSELMYNSWLGTSAGIIVKQAAYQLPNVAGVELTPTYLLRGVQHLAKKTPMYREAFARNFHRMAPTDTIDFAEQATAAANGSKLLPEYVDKIVKAATYPTRKTTLKGFMKLDKFWNRQVAFNGGMSRFMDTGGDVNKIAEITQNLWPAQRRELLNTLKTKGLQAAAEDYGVLKSLRVNYMYSVADKPDMLRGDLAKYIPFTTWTRNQWMRFMGDAVNDPLSLAERIGYPAAFTAMVSSITGLEVPRSEPVTSLAGINMTPAPMIAGVADELGRGRYDKAGQEALSIFPVAGAINRAKRIEKKGLLKGLSFRRGNTISLADLFDKEN